MRVRRGGRPEPWLGFRLAQAACIVGLMFAAISVFWALGGTWLLDTTLGQHPPGGNVGVMLLWAAAAIKTIAALVPLLAIHGVTVPAWNRTVRAFAWVEAAMLTIYGLALTAVGLLIQAGVMHVSVTANHRGLAWHAYLWDPWFLIWGLLVTAALMLGRRRRQRTDGWSAHSLWHRTRPRSLNEASPRAR